MGVFEARGQLTKATRELTQRWNEAKMSWDDARTQSFEQKFLQPLEADLRVAVGAMDQMATLLQQIQRECA